MAKCYSDASLSLEKIKEEYISLLNSVDRPGMDKLIQYLQTQTDFFSAPASTKFHESRAGGLLRHSMNVYARLSGLLQLEFKKYPDDYPDERRESLVKSAIVVALLHDICKSNFYEVSIRNVKNPQTGVWEHVPYYSVREDILAYGHGEESVYIASGFIRLSREEAFAIRYHMGAFEDKDTRNLGRAYSTYGLATLTHAADLLASYMDELDTTATPG